MRQATDLSKPHVVNLIPVFPPARSLSFSFSSLSASSQVSVGFSYLFQAFFCLIFFKFFLFSHYILLFLAFAFYNHSQNILGKWLAVFHFHCFSFFFVFWGLSLTGLLWSVPLKTLPRNLMELLLVSIWVQHTLVLPVRTRTVLIYVLSNYYAPLFLLLLYRICFFFITHLCSLQSFLLFVSICHCNSNLF